MTRLPAIILTLVVCAAGASAQLAGQRTTERDRNSAALEAMVQTERRFAARALVVGWKQAFLEYFADDAVGFDGDQAAAAKDLFRKLPDPPKDLQLIWEPRYGDIAQSGDLGYLTGPVRRVVRGQSNGHPFHQLYASIWKRQTDGSFKVVMDMGVPTPGPVLFTAGFTRAPRIEGPAAYGAAEATTKSLRDTDAALTNAARAGQADAYRGHLAPGARFHRANLMPVVGADAVVQWLATQPAYASGQSRYAETSRAGDLGYTYGTYALKGSPNEHGFYVRVWSRAVADRVWRVALDVLQ